MKRKYYLILSCLFTISLMVGCNNNSTEDTNSEIETTPTKEQKTTEHETAEESTTENSTEPISTEVKIEKVAEKETEKVTTAPTVAPTQPQTETFKPTETQVQTSTQPVAQPQFYDPYTWQPISKEEYESIWNEINNPEPTEPITQAENVYVFNDDGTINLKKSIINRRNITNGTEDEVKEFMEYLKNSREVKTLLGNYYDYISYYSMSWSMGNPTFFFYIDDYKIILNLYFNEESWVAYKGDDLSGGGGYGSCYVGDPYSEYILLGNWD